MLGISREFWWRSFGRGRVSIRLCKFHAIPKAKNNQKCQKLILSTRELKMKDTMTPTKILMMVRAHTSQFYNSKTDLEFEDVLNSKEHEWKQHGSTQAFITCFVQFTIFTQKHHMFLYYPCSTAIPPPSQGIGWHCRLKHVENRCLQQIPFIFG